MNILLISICLVSAGIASWFVSPWALVSYAIGIVLATTLSLITLRRLGRKAQESTLSSILFHKITRYKATVYNIQLPPNKTHRATIYGEGQEYADMLDILKNQLRFPAPEAREAATYAMDTGSEQPFQEKIRIALQYLGGNTKNVSTND